MSWWKKIFSSEGEQKNSEPELTELQRFAAEQATSLMEIINESLQLANNSTNPSTKVSLLEVARQKLDSLVLVAVQHPFIKLQRLDAVRKTIAQLAEEFTNAGYYVQPGTGKNDFRQDVWRNLGTGNATLMKGWRFGATMQLRTPLRVLPRHGEIHEGLDDPPPIAQNQSEGYWTPLLKSFNELGIELPEIVVLGRTTASDIGQIPFDGGEYLKFLLEVRSIVEGKGTIEEREATLRNELSQPKWCEVCDKVGGVGVISGRFFPSFLSTIGGLSHTVIWAMEDAGLKTPEKINHTSDADVLSIKGIGNTKLKSIRAACAVAPNPKSASVERIVR